MEKKCSKCKTTFRCSNEEKGCWCEDVQVSNEVLQYLKTNYQNCLCPKCLSEFSIKETGSLENQTNH